MYIINTDEAFQNGVVLNGSFPYVNHEQTQPIETFGLTGFFARALETNETESYVYETTNINSFERQPSVCLRFMETENIEDVAIDMQKVMDLMNEQVKLVTFGSTERFVIGYSFIIDARSDDFGNQYVLMFSENQWMVLQPTTNSHNIVFTFPENINPFSVIEWCRQEFMSKPGKTRQVEPFVLTNSTKLDDILTMFNDSGGNCGCCGDDYDDDNCNFCQDEDDYDDDEDNDNDDEDNDDEDNDDDQDVGINSFFSRFINQTTDDEEEDKEPQQQVQTTAKQEKPVILMTPQETREYCIEQMREVGMSDDAIGDVINSLNEDDYASKTNYSSSLRTNTKRAIANHQNQEYKSVSLDDVKQAFTMVDDSRTTEDKKLLSIAADGSQNVVIIPNNDAEPEPVSEFENNVMVNEVIKSPMIVKFKDLPYGLTTGTSMNEDDTIRFVDYAGVMVGDNRYLIQENKVDFPIVHAVNVKLLNGSSMFDNSVTYQATKIDISKRAYVVYFVASNEYIVMRLP